MIRKMYSVYDEAAQAYATPFFLNTDEQAKRGFIDAVQKDENLNCYAKDYSLCITEKI